MLKCIKYIVKNMAKKLNILRFYRQNLINQPQSKVIVFEWQRKLGHVERQGASFNTFDLISNERFLFQRNVRRCQVTIEAKINRSFRFRFCNERNQKRFCCLRNKSTFNRNHFLHLNPRKRKEIDWAFEWV